MRTSLLFIFLLSVSFIQAQSDRILLDEDFSDWQAIPVAHTDPSGDSGNSNIDFGNLWISNDDDFIFFRLEVGTEINLQDNNEITIYLDTDNDANTGFTTNGIGAEIIYNFGARSGNIFVGNNNLFIEQADLWLVSSPTVTSDQFEIAISRHLSFFGQAIYQDNNIKVLIKNNLNNTDVLPDGSGGVSYTFNNDIPAPLPEYTISQPPASQVRIMSYNVLFDNLFENNLQPYYNRIISSIDPDIIGFQEIYDHNSTQTANKVETFLPSGNNEEWYHAKIQPDIIAVSRFPIISAHLIGTSVNETEGNGAFLIDLDPATNTKLLFVVAHTPCCNNNFDRQREIDAIMAFVRNAKDGSGPAALSANDPILIVGDMNLVGDQQQQTTLITGDIVNQSAYGAAFDPDWDGTTMDDAKPLASNLPLTITWYNENSSFSPGRLDYMLYSGSVMDLENAFTLFTPSLSQDQLTEHGLGINDVIEASDHLPVVGDFDFSIVIATSEIEQAGSVGLGVFPNPFKELSNLSVELLQKTEVRVELLDLNGKKIALIYEGLLDAGRHQLGLSAANLVDGVYICRVLTKFGVISKKIAVLK